jgi:predicted anti-sigma-YlaC factor YlaD
VTTEPGCKRFEQAWLAGEPLNQQARDHLRECPACAALYEMMRRQPVEPLPSELEQRLIETAQRDLAPVKPIAAPYHYALLMLAASAAIASLALFKLGLAGWKNSGAPLRAYLAAWLLAGLGLGAVHIARLMVPGALLCVRPAVLTAVSGVAVLLAAAFYPIRYYDHFVRALATCFAIGMAVAIPTGILVNLVLRRGFVVNRPAASLLAGLFSGFTALVVLFLFCPHLDAGHYLFAHMAVVAASLLLLRASPYK